MSDKRWSCCQSGIDWNEAERERVSVAAAGSVEQLDSIHNEGGKKNSFTHDYSLFPSITHPLFVQQMHILLIDVRVI